MAVLRLPGTVLIRAMLRRFIVDLRPSDTHHINALPTLCRPHHCARLTMPILPLRSHSLADLRFAPADLFRALLYRRHANRPPASRCPRQSKRPTSWLCRRITIPNGAVTIPSAPWPPSAIARPISSVLCRRSAAFIHSLPSPCLSSHSQVIHCLRRSAFCCPVPLQSGSNHRLALPPASQSDASPHRRRASPRLPMLSSRLASRILALPPLIYSVLGFAPTLHHIPELRSGLATHRVAPPLHYRPNPCYAPAVQYCAKPRSYWSAPSPAPASQSGVDLFFCESALSIALTLRCRAALCPCRSRLSFAPASSVDITAHLGASWQYRITSRSTPCRSIRHQAFRRFQSRGESFHRRLCPGGTSDEAAR